ncbi:MAG TPA: ABC transporter permease [Candidatus Aminicenantes bacterium]|nr:ABC transporter permease [Candidatus Aminicenantes bacterium]
MGFYWKLAWRNILRNKRRTFIASVTIGIGLASLIFTDALIIGMKDSLIRSTTSSFLGEAQIHHENYRLSREAELVIKNASQVVNQLEKDDSVAHFASRTQAFGMLTSPANVQSVLLVGVDPERERRLSQFDDALTKGDRLDKESHGLVIGSKLAETLEIDLGERVVMTVARVDGGDLSQEMFRVSGIYHFGIREMDSGFALVPIERAQQMLGLEREIHEIAVRFHNMRDAENPDLPFWKRYSVGGNEAAGWPELMPEMKNVLDLTDFSMLIMALILAGVVVFGIINTLFMSMYERMFEFGVLRAVGTRAGGIRKLIVLEALALGLVSTVIGVLLGLAVTAIVSHTGIDYRGIEMTGVHIREIIYPVLRGMQFVKYPLWVILFCTLVGFYPAWVAGRMQIASALRKSL